MADQTYNEQHIAILTSFWRHLIGYGLIDTAASPRNRLLLMDQLLYQKLGGVELGKEGIRVLDLLVENNFDFFQECQWRVRDVLLSP